MQQKIDQVLAVLQQAVRDFSPVCFANSLGAEDMVLTNLIARNRLDIAMFSLDTGRLPQETYDLMQEVRKHYAVPLEVYFPDNALVEEYVAQHGINGFYDTVENRKSCCFVRKVEPLRRALAGKGAWITGMRRDQAVTRGNLEVSGPRGEDSVRARDQALAAVTERHSFLHLSSCSADLAVSEQVFLQ